MSESQEGIQKPELADDYREILEDTYEILEESGQHYRLGPQFLARTSKGLDLQIKTFNADQIEGLDFVGTTVKHFFVFALDSDERVVGFKFAGIDLVRKILGATGYTTTGLRGQGIALPIELAYIYLIEKECRNNNVPIIWKTGNLSDQEDVQMQTRWNALYGNEGLLGLTDDLLLLLPSFQMLDQIRAKLNDRVFDLFPAEKGSGGKRRHKSQIQNLMRQIEATLAS